MSRFNLRTKISFCIVILLLLSFATLGFMLLQMNKTDAGLATVNNTTKQNEQQHRQPIDTLLLHEQLVAENEAISSVLIALAAQQKAVNFTLVFSLLFIILMGSISLFLIRNYNNEAVLFAEKVSLLLSGTKNNGKNTLIAENQYFEFALNEVAELYGNNERQKAEIEEVKAKNESIANLLNSEVKQTITEQVQTITALENANAALKEAKEKYEEHELKFSKLFFILPEPFTITSLETGKFILTNDAFLKGTGFTEEEILNHTSIELNVWVNIEDRQRWVEELKKNGGVRNLELSFRTKKFGIRDYLVSSDIIEFEGEKCTINSYVDITLRKQAENELRRAKEKAEESDKLKTAFLQNISHEIRTPMNAIIGFSGFLTKKTLSDEKKIEYIDIVQKSSRQLLAIVTDILTISSLQTNQESLNNSQFDLNEVFEGLLAVFGSQAEKKNLRLSVVNSNHYPDFYIHADKSKLTQVLNNLLTNALKFTHVGYVEFGYKLCVDCEPKEIEFFVKDTGIGIKAENQKSIFEHFRQAEDFIQYNYGGTGLGLSISKGFVELLGGKIWLVSKPGKGSAFHFSIPYSPVDEKERLTLLTKKDKIFTTILVAEDE
ncbi:MAG TPA: hypothetical protein DCQ31_00825, partial [Bacteroidales bacterium]|nr:hypothetical protein [Bacteroidales bacterium]